LRNQLTSGDGTKLTWLGSWAMSASGWKADIVIPSDYEWPLLAQSGHSETAVTFTASVLSA
jgi:hypothetical protein